MRVAVWGAIAIALGTGLAASALVMALSNPRNRIRRAWLDRFSSSGSTTLLDQVVSKNARKIVYSAGVKKQDKTRKTETFDIQAAQRLDKSTKRPTYVEKDNQTGVLAEGISLILLGGPVNNLLTRQAFKEYAGLLPYTFRHNAIIGTGEKWESIPPPGSAASVQYGLLTFVPHPRSPSERLLIAAGCWGHGTLGAVRALLRWDRRLYRATGGSPFQVVIATRPKGANRIGRTSILWDTLRVMESLDPSAPVQPEKQVSVIIPCKEEGATVDNLVKTFAACAEVQEVIVVNNDGNPSAYVSAKKLGAKVIDEARQGKGYALVRGIQEASSPYLFLIDGDIANAATDWMRRICKQLDRFKMVRGNPDYFPRHIIDRTQSVVEIFCPELGSIEQPFGGIVGLRAEYAEQLKWYPGWGVDVGLTLQALSDENAYAEVQLGELQHTERAPEHYDSVAREIVRTILHHHFSVHDVLPFREAHLSIRG